MIEQHRAWLHARGITDETIARFGLDTHTDHKGGQWLRVPFLEGGALVNHKSREISAKHHRMDKDAPLLLFNHAALVEAAASGQPLVITEGEWDALVCIQSGHELTVSVPNGAAKESTPDVFDAKRYEWFHRHRADLDRVSKFILATDSDEAGLVLAADLARLLGPERCCFVEYPTGKDLNDVLLALGEEAVRDVVATAKPYPVQGLYTIEDFPEPPPFRATPIGIEGLEDLWPVVAGTFSVITGWPGHGKSSAVLVAIANLMKQGMPVCVGSFETMVKPVLQRRLRACMYQCSEDYDGRVKTHGPADVVMADKLRIISNLHVNDTTELSIEGIIDLAIIAVLRDGVRLIVLDPWNEIEHKRGDKESESDYHGRAIRLLKRFAKDYHCAVWVVAHPRKPSSDGAPRRPSLLDLAGCYSDDTEVLTAEGWKRHEDLTLDDQVASFDPVGERLSYRRPERIIRKDYDGEMMRFKGYGFDLLVTPEHRMVVKPRWSDPVGSQIETGIGRPQRWSKVGWSFCEAKDLPRAEFRLPLAAPFDVPSLPDQAVDIGIARLIGWYVSEGCGTGNGLSITQAIGHRADEIEDLLKSLNIKYSKRDSAPGGKGGKLPMRQFYIGVKANRGLVELFKRECGVGSANKRIPRAVFTAQMEVKAAVMETYLAGDGSPRRGDGFVASTTSQLLADDIQRLALELGLTCSIGSKVSGKSDRHADQWQINIGQSVKQTAMFNPARNLTMEKYTGPVWCLTVPGGAYVTRRNGKATICGNSAHFANKADYGVIFHREDLSNDLVEAIVVKKRMGLPGAMGRVLLSWNEITSSYSQEGKPCADR